MLGSSPAEAGSCASGRWVTVGCSCPWPGSAVTTSAAGGPAADPGRGGRGHRRGHHPVRHRGHLRSRRRLRRTARPGTGQPPRPDRAGHQVRPSEGGHGLRARGRGQGRPGLHPPRGDRLAAPAAYRLSRPLPAAHPGPGDPDRGNPARADRAGHRGQGALPGALQPVRLADRRCRAPGPARRHRGVRLRAERVVAAGAGGRGGAGARGPALWAGRAAVLPAGQWPAHREGAAWPAARPGTRLAAGRAMSPSPSWTGSRRSASGPRGTGSACSMWPSAGWPRSPAARR